MKVALKQSAMPTSPTANQDFTDTGFSSDVKLLLPFLSRGITNDTIADEFSLSVGATDGTTQAAISNYCQDNIGTTAIARSYVNATNAAILAPIGGGGTLDAEAPGSLLSNGGRLAWASWANNELINALLIGGSDVAASVVSATLNGTTPVSVTHGLGDTPDIIIAFTTAAATSNTTGNFCVGFYDRVGATYASVSHRCGAAATTQTNQYVSTAAIATEVSNTALVWSATVSSLGATTFNVVADAATTDIIKFVCLKVTGGAYKVGTFTTKTTTGTQADITGMSSAPQMVIYLPSLMTALNTFNDTGNSESMGIGVAVNNNGSTEQGSIAGWNDDGITLGTTNTKSVTSNTKAGLIFSGTGTVAVDWAISSWDSGGITNNYTTANGAANYVAYLAIGGAGATKFLKLLAHASAASATSVEGVVLNATRDTVIGEFTGQAFEGTLESGKAVLKIPVADFGGGSLTTSDTPLTVAYNGSKTTGLVSCTVIEE